jgi:hypothetical protein
MLLIDKPIDLKKLEELAEKNFAGLVKAVVDVEKEMMVIGGEMHADEEKMLLENDSKQQDLWGINLYPQNFGKEDFIEFDSVINLRPSQNNLSRFVEDEKIRQKIIKIVDQLIKK